MVFSSDTVPSVPHFQFQFQDGDPELVILPPCCRIQIENHCSMFQVLKPGCARKNQYKHSNKGPPYHFLINKGNRTNFVLPNTEEIMLSACYTCGSFQIVVVQQKARSAHPLFNGGKPAIVFASDRMNGWKSKLWYVWDHRYHPSFRDYGAAAMHVEKLIMLHKALESSILLHDTASTTSTEMITETAGDEFDDAEVDTKMDWSDEEEDEPLQTSRLLGTDSDPLSSSEAAGPPHATSNNSDVVSPGSELFSHRDLTPANVTVPKFIFKKSLEDPSPLSIPVHEVDSNNRLFYCALAAGIATETTEALGVEFQGKTCYLVQGVDTLFKKLLREIQSRSASKNVPADIIVINFEWKRV